MALGGIPLCHFDCGQQRLSQATSGPCSVQYMDHSYWVVCLGAPFIRIRELNRVNGGCPVTAVSRKGTRHVLSVVPVEGRLLLCSEEPIHGVSVPESKPCPLH